MNRTAAIFIAIFWLPPSVFCSDTLNSWIASEIDADAELLADALAHRGGTTVELLKNSRFYVPFFLEAPQNFTFSAPEQKSSFDRFIKANTSEFLSGGYIFRLSFNKAPALYALSAGNWEPGAKKWHSLALQKNFAIEPGQVWSDGSNDYLYATIVGPPPPRLLVYGQDGEIQREEVFDASSKDFEQRMDAALKPYSQNNKPVLEMISLAEYLENRDAPWRPAEISGQFNLRNQQQRPDEQKRLRQSGQLTRTVTIDFLQPTQENTPSTSPPVTPALMTPAPVAMPAALPSSTAKETESSRSLPIVPMAILAAVIVGIVLYLLRRKSQ